MKILFAIVTLFITLTANSQVDWGVFAGPQVTDVRYTLNEKKQESSLKIGVNAGLQMKVPFEGRLSFAPSIMYNMRGYKVDKFVGIAFPPDSNAINVDTRFHTIEIAFLLQHDFKLEDGHFFFRITTNSATKVDRKMKFSFSDYGHYLASAIFQFGYDAKNGMFFYAHYNYGLTTMNNADNGPGIGNRAAGFTIGKWISPVTKRIKLN
jgi:Outer membrane protein beta-barrel domain